jgi:hypothetical protein
MRVHDFGDGFDAATAGGAPAGERETLPDGTHGVTIKEAREGPHKFAENYPGDFLHLTIAPNGSYGVVWVSLGSSSKDKAQAGLLATALGFTPDAWADADPSELVGRELRVTTKQVTLKSGKTRCFVNDYLPAVAAAPEKKPASRTPAAKVAAARGEEAGEADDIPFMWMLPLALAVASMEGLA